MKHSLLMAVTLLLAASPLFAQAGRGGIMGAGGGSVQMVCTAKGLFALRNGVLVKFDAATLKEAQLLEIFGPMPERPADNADREAMQKYMADMQQRRAAAVMLVKDNSLLVIIGDGFARINQDTLEVEATADLKNPADAGAAGAAAGARTVEPAPTCLLVEDTLYLLRSREVLSISVTDGKILARSPLPQQLQPAQMNFQRGAGGQGGAQGGRRGQPQPGAPAGQ